MASVNEILIPKAFDITKLSFGQPKQLSNGGRTVYVSYGGNRLLVQTPDLKAPFGISHWPGENGGPDKYNLDMSFDGMDSRESVKVFLRMLESIDRRLVSDAMENSQLWFRKKFPSEQVVEALYSRAVKYSKDRDTGEVTNRYPPTFKMALPFKDGQFQFPVFSPSRQQVDLMELVAAGRTKGARVQAIIQLTGIWMVGSKFGLTWKVRQLKISEPARLNGYAFQKMEDDDDNEDDAAAAPATSSTAKPTSAPAAPGGRASDADLQDSDVDGDVAEEGQDEDDDL